MNALFSIVVAVCAVALGMIASHIIFFGVRCTRQWINRAEITAGTYVIHKDDWRNPFKRSKSSVKLITSVQEGYATDGEYWHQPIDDIRSMYFILTAEEVASLETK